MKFTSIFFTASASIFEIHLKDRDLFWKCKEKQRVILNEVKDL